MTTTGLFGTAQRGRTRPRGFVEWSPDTSSQALVTTILAVLAEYADYLPLTIRQIFYRLVGVHNYPKTEGDYKRLCRITGRARRARLIDMDAIRDDGFITNSPDTWTSPEAFLAYVQEQASQLMLDRQAGQPTNLVIMCEAAGMVPQLARVAHQYSIPVMAIGGFDSLTSKYEFASSCEGDTEVLHIGDHDPSGVHIFSALAEDVAAFAEEELESDVTFTRLAVTPPQIKQYRLQTAPPKPTDRRAFTGQTCQAEALPPDVLAQIVRAAIIERLDEPQYKRVLSDEKKAHKWLMERLGAP